MKHALSNCTPIARVLNLAPVLLFCAAGPGCAAYFQEHAFRQMEEEFDREGRDIYIHDLARLKQIKKVIVPDFRVTFPTSIHGGFKVYAGSSHEGICFIADPGLGTLMAEHFEEALLKTRTIEVLERNQLQRLLNEMNLQMNGFIDSPNFQPGKLAGADTAILGTVTMGMFYMPDDPMLSSMEHISFRLRVIDLKTGAILLLYRDRRMIHGHNPDEDRLLGDFGARFVESLKKHGVIN